jgi:hypothetical protein
VICRRLVALAGAILFSLAAAQEPTAHDPAFEHWVRETFFGGYRTTGATPRWEIPASANPDHGGAPVAVKTSRVGMAIDLGEALRQYEIDEPFMLLVGFWEPAGDGKRFVQIVAPVVSPEQWRKLWGSVSYADLQRLDALIKDTGPTVEEIRRRVLLLKNSPPFNSAVIQLNPKLDERGPRRLQCSLRYQDLLAYLTPDESTRAKERPALFGVDYPNAPVAKAEPAKQN